MMLFLRDHLLGIGSTKERLRLDADGHLWRCLDPQVLAEFTRQYPHAKLGAAVRALPRQLPQRFQVQA